ncbi:unnamed protein product, partial [Discosporangium mesarthrocarpum]
MEGGRGEVGGGAGEHGGSEEYAPSDPPSSDSEVEGQGWPGGSGRKGRRKKAPASALESSPRDAIKKQLAQGIVQEEMDDADEERREELRQIAGERQRQLDALRVMGPSQREDSTRERKDNLVARIKQRQQRIHAELEASMREELARLGEAHPQEDAADDADAHGA